MVNNNLYGNQLDSSVVSDLKDIDSKIKDAKSSEELLKLRMAKLYRGMELNAGPLTRNYRGYYPY